MSRFERVGGATVYDGRLIQVSVDRFRHEDSEEVEREIIHHEGAVGILARDEERVWLVRQPREAVGSEALLEIPAGRLDVEGEQPLQTAQRELAEEVGFGADTWEPILSYYSSAGISDERVHLFLATGLFERSASSGENERIEIVPWPLARLDQAIGECEDAKTLIALLWLARRLNG